MTDIDWYAVHCVVSEGIVLKLHAEERKMVVRRLAERMISRNEHPHGNKLSQEEIGRRLQCTSRTVLRDCADLEPGIKQTCPVCGEPMWVVRGVVEAHPDRCHIECPMSGRVGRRGLAALRPELYLWVEEGVFA